MQQSPNDKDLPVDSSTVREPVLDARALCRWHPATAALAALPWLLLTVASCSSAPDPEGVVDLDIRVLQPVRSWAIQLQGLELDGALRRLETASVDMVVIEPMRSQHGLSDFPMADMVRRLQRSPGATLPGKRCIAYLNVGQAEDYRSYWRAAWRAPTADQRGDPDFLLGLDPDGWQGNYPVAFWEPAWRAQLYGDPEAPLDQILADGFDGIYMDWILGMTDPLVVAAAREAGIDPAAAMVDLLRDLRSYARRRYPLFVMIAQNALPLCEAHPEVLDVIDAISQEDLSFRGSATATWFDPEAGDTPAPPAGDWSTAALCSRLQTVAGRRLPVFTLDYALRPENIERALATSREAGFVPCVSRTPLDRL